MTYAPATPEFERLPWLNDEKKPAPGKGPTALVLWSILATLLIAGASYWIGMTSAPKDGSAAGPYGEGAPSATISLPGPDPVEQMAEEVALPRMPEVRPVRTPPQVSIPGSRSSVSATRPRQSSNSAGTARRRTSPAASSAGSGNRSEARTEQELWPARRSEGAAGRMVRIGTFATRLQAKRGWRQIVRAYPGMGRLRSVVVPSPSLRNGRTYYRLQFGTTSQAHSAVLCQWMRSVGQSCVVIGSPAGKSG